MNSKKEKTFINLFYIHGVVAYGRQRGRTVGMPTANLKTTEDISHIFPGVYAVTVEVRQKKYCGITHIGLRPSVDSDSDITVETYIFDFDEDIYGVEISLTGHMYIRGTREFKSLEEVKKQVENDIRIARKYLSVLECEI